ncbi:MAG: tRNA dihydrouridine synthase DusB [Gammaproteobacteria bacterium]|nr:tRNA dihydrouridine synthase DusB [Gammaproteobacteria bacterium]
MRIGPHVIDPPVILAPMAGVTDKPFRQLCRRFGAGLAVSEMTTADPRLWTTRKSRLRMDHADEVGPVSVQLAGTDPAVLAAAARHAADRGVAIVDLNMGCPAKKVCNVAAGSALLQDEPLVARILAAVASAVDIPVTVKIRTGYSRDQRNAVRIARIAEEAGIAAVAVHGRTRQDFFTGDAEYETVAAVKAAVRIPVVANGDLATPEKAVRVLRETGCDAVMLGRPALGRPWIFREVAHLLGTGRAHPPPAASEVAATVLGHVAALHAFYGEPLGVRIARKHLAWYCAGLPGATLFRTAVNRVETPATQVALVADYLGEALSLAATG